MWLSSFKCGLQVFDINPLRAWSAVAITLASVALSIYAIAMSPWYLLPLAWAFAGTAWTGVSNMPEHTTHAVVTTQTAMQCMRIFVALMLQVPQYTCAAIMLMLSNTRFAGKVTPLVPALQFY